MSPRLSVQAAEQQLAAAKVAEETRRVEREAFEANAARERAERVARKAADEQRAFARPENWANASPLVRALHKTAEGRFTSIQHALLDLARRLASDDPTGVIPASFEPLAPGTRDPHDPFARWSR